jgi:ribosomal protein S19
VVPLPLKQAREKRQAIRTNARSCTILPSFVSLRFQVHNGRDYVAFQIKDEMVGMKLGDFAPTRQRHMHKDKNKPKQGFVMKKK